MISTIAKFLLHISSPAFLWTRPTLGAAIKACQFFKPFLVTCCQSRVKVSQMTPRLSQALLFCRLTTDIHLAEALLKRHQAGTPTLSTV